MHQPSASYYGQAADIARHAQEIVKLKRRLNEIYSHHTGQPVEAVEKALDRDTYMTAEEAKTFGLIDQVLERRPEPGAEVVSDPVRSRTVRQIKQILIPPRLSWSNNALGVSCFGLARFVQ